MITVGLKSLLTISNLDAILQQSGVIIMTPTEGYIFPSHYSLEAEAEVQTLLKSTEFDKLVSVGDFEKKPDAANINNGG